MLQRVGVWAFVVWAALLVPSWVGAQVRQPPPVIERIEPTTVTGGGEVQILGRFFRGDQRVFVGEVELPVRSRMPSRWAATVPAEARTGRIELRLADGTRVVGPELHVLTTVAAPRITGMTPTAAAPGTEIRIQGEHFSPRITDNRVTLGALPLVVRSATPTELVVILPSTATTGSITVQVGAAAATSPQPLTVSTAMRIESFVPTVASTGMRVVLNGVGFGERVEALRVFLGTTPLRIVLATPSAITVELPPASTTGLLRVDLRGGGRAEASAPLTIRSAVTVTDLQPTAGTVGAQVRVTGTGFGTDVRQVQATVGGVALLVRGVTETALTLEIPQGATSGAVDIAIGGLAPVTTPVPLRVLVPAAVTGISPTSGPVGSEVLIRGRGFSPTLTENRVTMAGVACEVLGATDAELRVRVPQAASGPLVVDVVNAGTARSAQPFVITTPPVITAVEPNAATIGSTIVVRGTHFGTTPSVVEVALAGRRMELRSLAEDRLEAVVPVGASSGPITVTVRLQGTGTTARDFTVQMEFGFTAIEPASAHPGQRVRVRGGGFLEDGTTVQFAGSTAPARATFVNGQLLEVTVPSDAATGPLTVRMPDGRSLTQGFTRAEGPPGMGIARVESACPLPAPGQAACVPFAAGSPLTIWGWGFGTAPGQQTVRLGRGRLRVLRATPFELTVLLPRRPETGPLRIERRGQAPVEGAPVAIVGTP